MPCTKFFKTSCWWTKSQTTTWDVVQNPVNDGINYQPQLVNLPDFWTINSPTVFLTLKIPPQKPGLHGIFARHALEALSYLRLDQQRVKKSRIIGAPNKNHKSKSCGATLWKTFHSCIRICCFLSQIGKQRTKFSKGTEKILCIYPHPIYSSSLVTVWFTSSALRALHSAYNIYLTLTLSYLPYTYTILAQKGVAKKVLFRWTSWSL